MFDLTLTPEQIEMRDTLHDFAQQEMKAAAIHPLRKIFETPSKRPLKLTVMREEKEIQVTIDMRDKI